MPGGNVTLAVALLTAVVGLNAGQYTGYLVRFFKTHVSTDDRLGINVIGVTLYYAK